ncbi:MAG: hypothetical protein KGH61_04690 [Candidatus Micrarchaeota archaeon]|nr:hypothetical protein [Candidatus Micrarchaeota archaeon]MDE1848215.1 hypothetical protein [Candidatus Micrarchaeota archaeon]MDE1864863.1 hypothetical protein [Candidatus Micrarchaeota archaeon]
MIEALNLKDTDDVDFFRFNSNSFLFAKKSDITELIVGKAPKETKAETMVQPREAGGLESEEISVLKKLDTLKYKDRTREKVEQMLNGSEKVLLQGMLKKKAVTLFAKEKGSEPLYGISKNVYDQFLMRKRQGAQVQQPQAQAVATQSMPRFKPAALENESVKELEQKGFVVLQSEAEASSLSLALEDSIRHGQVLGTRAFNKKFYIILRSYFNRNGAKIIKELKGGDKKVWDIASNIDVEEDGVRGILYLLSESGEVSERRRDVFTLA